MSVLCVLCQTIEIITFFAMIFNFYFLTFCQRVETDFAIWSNRKIKWRVKEFFYWFNIFPFSYWMSTCTAMLPHISVWITLIVPLDTIQTIKPSGMWIVSLFSIYSIVAACRLFTFILSIFDFDPLLFVLLFVWFVWFFAK